MADLRRPLAGTTLELGRDRAPQVDNRLPAPGSKTALAAELEALRAQLARAEADNARLRAAAPTTTPAHPVLASVAIPVLLVSEANQRDHHHTKAKRVRHQRTTTGLLLNTVPPAQVERLRAHLRQGGRLSVHLERRAGRLLDDDNLVGSGKHVRDQLAAWLQVDDGPRGPIAWSYTQQAHRRWSRTPECLVEVRVLP